jgi:hypothetical protein
MYNVTVSGCKCWSDFLVLHWYLWWISGMQYRCLIRGRNCLPFANTWFHRWFCSRICVAHLFSFLCCVVFFVLFIFFLCLVSNVARVINFSVLYVLFIFILCLVSNVTCVIYFSVLYVLIVFILLTQVTLDTRHRMKTIKTYNTEK